VDPDERKKKAVVFSLGTDILHYSTLLKIKEPKAFVVVVAVMQEHF